MSTPTTHFSDGKDLGGAVTRTLDNAANSVHKAIDQASGAARPAVDHMASSAHGAVDRLGDAATHAVDAIGVRSGQVRDMQSRLTSSCRSQVRDTPIASIAVAAAGGFLLGWLLRQR